MNENGKIKNILQDRILIEKSIIEYKKKIFRQAYESKVYKDKIYHTLYYNKARDKILKRELDGENVITKIIRVL